MASESDKLLSRTNIETITYETAISRSVNPNPTSPPLNACRRFWTSLSGNLGPFASISVSLFLLEKSVNVLYLFGLAFLTKGAKNYECLSEEDNEWHICSRDYICSNGLSSDKYRPIKDDEYIDGWVPESKLNLLCEPRYKIGLIGSIYFIGCTMLLWPILSDTSIGRRKLYLWAVSIFTVAFLGLILSTNLTFTYVCMFLLGATWGGRVVVGLSWFLELTPPAYHSGVVLFYELSEPVLLIMLTFWYQFIDRSWLNVYIIGFVIVALSLVYMFSWVPESPKWLYTWRQFDKAREVLEYIARFNGVDKAKIDSQITNTMFYKEKRNED